jgi:hypothetical protein
MLDFTFPSYVALLNRLKNRHKFLTFSDVSGKTTNESYVLLRHDVDFSPPAALAMAELEAQEGVRSTYFFLLSSPYYNLLSADFCRIPRRISALGHEVGLHYDVQALIAQADGGDPAPAFHREIQLLGSIAETPVASVACHQPSLLSENPFSGTVPFHDAYAPPVTSAIAYFSDSGRAWRDKTFQAFTGGDLPAQLQLLLHPVLWTGTAANRWDWLADFFADKAKELAADHERMRLIWVDHSGVKEHDRRVQTQGFARSL